MDGEAGWWTTSGNIGLPPLARAMGVGRQQHALLPHLNPDLYLTISLTSEAESQEEAELSALIQGKGKIDSACPVDVVRLTHHVLYNIPCGIFVFT